MPNYELSHRSTPKRRHQKQIPLKAQGIYLPLGSVGTELLRNVQARNLLHSIVFHLNEECIFLNKRHNSKTIMSIVFGGLASQPKTFSIYKHKHTNACWQQKQTNHPTVTLQTKTPNKNPPRQSSVLSNFVGILLPPCSSFGNEQRHSKK